MFFLKTFLSKTFRAQGPHKAAQGCLVRNPVAGGATATSQPDLVPDLVPNLVPDLVPNLVPNLVPDLIPDLVPNLVSNLVPDLVPDLVRRLATSQEHPSSAQGGTDSAQGFHTRVSHKAPPKGPAEGFLLFRICA